MALINAVTHEFSTAWPEAGKRWAPEAKKHVGVYALVWDSHAYVGMTISSGGFQGRWARHHRSLFVKKRANSTTKLMRDFIRANNLVAQDFTLLALQCWPVPDAADDMRALSDQIALVEQARYDEFVQLGFTMLNNVRPRGSGYAKPARKTRRRRTATKRPSAS